jgi:hypothetical protein
MTISTHLLNIVVNLNQAKDNIARCIRAGLVAFLEGPPAAGKSAIVRQIAEEYDLKLIDLRLSQCDPCDLLGFPRINESTSKASYAPMETFPLEGDPIPEGYNGWLLLFDELTSAPRAVQAAAYKILHEKEVGLHKIHPNVAMVAAGNRDIDNAIVEPMSTALQSRLVHMEVAVDNNVWLEWAMRNGIDHRITSYIKFKPTSLYTFDPDHTDKTYASPRTWEYLSRLIKNEDSIGHDLLPLIAGTVSQGVGREFIQHTKIYDKLPTVEEIISRPAQIVVPEEPSILFALTGAIASRATEDNIGTLLKYTSRLPKEFEIVCLKEAVRRLPGIEDKSAMRNWIVENSAELL